MSRFYEEIYCYFKFQPKEPRIVLFSFIYAFKNTLSCALTLQSNHAERYAIHQLTNAIGIVAMSDHISGNVKSATNPNMRKTVQKIFFSTPPS